MTLAVPARQQLREKRSTSLHVLYNALDCLDELFNGCSDLGDAISGQLQWNDICDSEDESSQDDE